MSENIKDAARSHWVYKTPKALRPYLQLSRLDRPIGYWLLALPGFIGLAFAALSYGAETHDLKWAGLILIGAIAMRGAGCTYNDIVDQELDKQVERTALRPLPAGTITTRQAWVWVLAQCAVGLIVLLCLPRLAQIIALCSIPLVAAYPFMKRITWWPQIWLGLTFNWAVLVAYAAKTNAIASEIFILYAALVFWTVGYDTIYACQDIEDDALAGIKSTARRFGKWVKLGVAVSYLICLFLVAAALTAQILPSTYSIDQIPELAIRPFPMFIYAFFFALHLLWQIVTFKPSDSKNALRKFKSNFWAGIILAGTFLIPTALTLL